MILKFSHRRLFILTCLLFLISCQPEPASTDYWQPTEAPMIFEGEALYDYINGGAEKFFAQGFNQLKVQRYLSPKYKDPIFLEVYEMKQPVGAQAIYESSPSSQGKKIKIGQTGRLYPNLLECLQDSYYLRVYGSTTGISEVLIEIAKKVIGNLPAKNSPAK